MGSERNRAQELADRLGELYGDDLDSVVLYGSAARGDFREGASDLNLLVLLRRLDAAALHRAAPLARDWVEAGNPPPLMMSAAEWAGSADVFPIEYADIRDAHVVLRGRDPIGSLRIGWADLRLQAERELKEKKIQLREHFMLAAESPEEVGALLERALSTFLALFRAALRLAGDPVPTGSGALIDAAAARIGFDDAAWREVDEARRSGEPLAPDPEGPLVASYLDGVARAAEWLDGLPAGDDRFV